MDEELKKRIEAILFSIGSKINVTEIMRMTREKDKAKIVSCLIELKNKYNTDENNSLMILQDGDDWKLTIKDQYIEVAKEIGIETELRKTVLETLAVIAYKNPCLQAEVIRVRTNKAYDHLLELEQLGYIERERFGRTKKIKLTPKFFDYFELPPESLREKFKNVVEMEKGITVKERQIHEIGEMKREKIEEMKREDDERLKENIFVTNPNNPNTIDVVSETKEGLGMIVEEKLGGLTVIDEEDYNLPKVKSEKDDRNNAEFESEESKTAATSEIDIRNNAEFESEESKATATNNGELQIASADYSFEDHGNVNENAKNTKIYSEPDKASDQSDIFNPVEKERTGTDEEIIGEIQKRKTLINSSNEDNISNALEDNNNESGSNIAEEPAKESVNSDKDDFKYNSIERVKTKTRLHSEPISEKSKADQNAVNENEILNRVDDDPHYTQSNEDIEIIQATTTDEDDDIEKKEYNIPSSHMKEEKLFNMDDMPTNLMDKIERRAEEIIGEIKQKKVKAEDNEAENNKDNF